MIEDPKRKARDALVAKLFDADLFDQVESLPTPVYNFNPEGWMLNFASN